MSNKQVFRDSLADLAEHYKGLELSYEEELYPDVVFVHVYGEITYSLKLNYDLKVRQQLSSLLFCALATKQTEISGTSVEDEEQLLGFAVETLKQNHFDQIRWLYNQYITALGYDSSYSLEAEAKK